jgi:small subunit ribosomal protein S5e
VIKSVIIIKYFKQMVEKKTDEIIVEDKPEFAVEPKLYGRWSYEGIECSDISLAAYLQVKTVKQQVFVPYTAGRYQ